MVVTKKIKKIYLFLEESYGIVLVVEPHWSVAEPERSGLLSRVAKPSERFAPLSGLRADMLCGQICSTCRYARFCFFTFIYVLVHFACRSILELSFSSPSSILDVAVSSNSYTRLNLSYPHAAFSWSIGAVPISTQSGREARYSFTPGRFSTACMKAMSTSRPSKDGGSRSSMWPRSVQMS